MKRREARLDRAAIKTTPSRYHVNHLGVTLSNTKKMILSWPKFLRILLIFDA